MSHVALYLLGPPRIELDGVPVKVDRRKAIALLAYLAVTGESHRRDSLVNLLWPEYDGARGRAALRRTLYALRKALGGDWLEVDREELSLAPTDSQQVLWVDVIQFRQHLQQCETHAHPPSQACPACAAPVSEAVALVRGDFLSGFGLKDSFNFDDWQLLETEALRRELAGALERLVGWHSAQREFDAALGYARRRLALDPLDEEAHRQLMRLYAWSGRRPAALRQYEECVAVLEEQLGVPPQEETTALQQAIEAGCAPPLPEDGGEPVARDLPAGPSAFLGGEALVDRPVFVARERELAQLDRHLQTALAGQGRVVFVTGDAGCGKTALIQEFARRAQELHPGLVVAGGHGNAHTGVGDPYLPFREILGLLAGDVEARWAAGAMTREQARRLWHLLPRAVQALVETGPDLMDTFVVRTALLKRAMTYAPGRPDWLTRLAELVQRKAQVPGMPELQQSALFEQYTQVLRALAGQSPLLLTLDDLQWADAGSLNLLFHLGRRIGGSPILIVGAYRPAEIALGRPVAQPTAGTITLEAEEARQRHPLAPIVNEFKRTFGAAEVDLEQMEGRRFVDALLDSEPNRLGDGFREALQQHTQGHPLFTVELLRGMQERGDLALDGEAYWVEGPALDWETLPARVEAVVAERIGRLPPPLREMLSVASVEGETFTAEVVARVQASGAGEAVRCLSEALDRQHRLVRAQGIVRLDGQRLSQYRFRHILYQRYLYGSRDPVELAYLHEQVGLALEALYGVQGGTAAGAEIAPQLARHFEEAGLGEKAIHYLCQAGERALRLCAYQEAMTLLTQGLALLPTRPRSPERDEQELALEVALGKARLALGSYAPEAWAAHTRALELGQRTGQAAQLCQALGEMAIFHYVRAEHDRARDLAEEALTQAQKARDPLLVAWSDWHLGFILFSLGEYTLARDHLERAIASYAPRQDHPSFIRLPGPDAGLSALAYSACYLWCLGYPEQALKRSQEGLALARELGHTYSLCDVVCYGACMFNSMRRNWHELRHHAEELARLAEQLDGWLAMATWYRGTAMVMSEQVQEGMAQIRAGLVASESRGVTCHMLGAFCTLAGAQAKAGHPEEGLVTLAEAFTLMEERGERHWRAELYRLRAELLLMRGDEAGAEASFETAIAVARRQQARSWELRATTGLARLWQAQRRADEARQMLAEIYGWFTEGHDTPDLKEAKALLDELA